MLRGRSLRKARAPVNSLSVPAIYLDCVLMPWQLLSSITIVPGTNLLYEGNQNVQYSTFEFPSDVTVIHRYRGYIAQNELVPYGGVIGDRLTETNREEIWASRQYAEMSGSPMARRLFFIPENKSSDIGKLLNYYSFV